MNMAEKCAQQRQTPLRIFLRAVPVDEGGRGKSVAKVVQARPMAVSGSAQADAPRRGIERPMNRAEIQSITPARDKKVLGDRAPRPMPLALLEVMGQHLAGGGVQRNPSILTPFATADSEYPGLQIHVLELEVARFTQAKARDAEQTKQTVIDPGQQRTGSTVRTVCWERHMERGMQELFDLLIGIKVRPSPLGLEGQQARRRNLRARIARASIARELAHVTEATRPMGGLGVLGNLRPPQCQGLRDIRGAAMFHERGELRQRPTGIVHLEAETAAQGQILLNRLTKCVHRTPPGQR